MTKPPNVVGLFLAGAEVIATAVADPAVAGAWREPSVLEDQTVGGLAGHLARGGVFVVGTYLEADVPDGPPTFDRAATYFAGLMGSASPADHQAIRDRGAALAEGGPEHLVSFLRSRLDRLRVHLVETDPHGLIQVAQGSVMHLDHYLTTRVVEQVVHLDDLARSVERSLPMLPPEAYDVAISVGLDLAELRSGAPAVVRALYRDGCAEGIFPVL